MLPLGTSVKQTLIMIEADTGSKIQDMYRLTSADVAVKAEKATAILSLN